MEYQKQKGYVFLITIIFLIFAVNFPIYAQQIPETIPEQMDDPNLLDEIPDEGISVVVQDPYEKFNRGTFIFNEKIDLFFLKPIATLYNAIMPRPLNRGIHNVFNNINTVSTIVNDILQVHFYQAANDIWRLGINTTLGIGGLFDVAGRIGLEPYSNDFGLTLATWGYRNSNYLVLPFFGPTTVRDGIEIPVDYYAFSIYPYLKIPVRYGVFGVSVIDRRAQLLKFQSVLEEVAIDKYSFQRNAYMQRRQCQIEANLNLGVGVKSRLPFIPLKENTPSGVNIGT